MFEQPIHQCGLLTLQFGDLGLVGFNHRCIFRGHDPVEELLDLLIECLDLLADIACEAVIDFNPALPHGAHGGAGDGNQIWRWGQILQQCFKL